MLPPYERRSKSLEVLIPILYLKGVLRQRLRSSRRYSRMAASLPDYGPACRMTNERDSFIGQL
jgi:hypothetical protein